MPKLSRRGLFQTALATAILSPTPALPQAAESNELLRAAREENVESAKAMAAVSLPQSTEPAFTFKP